MWIQVLSLPISINVLCFCVFVFFFSLSFSIRVLQKFRLHFSFFRKREEFFHLDFKIILFFLDHQTPFCFIWDLDLFFTFRTSLFIITSLVYAMLLIVVCIAYVISDVSTHRLPVVYYEGYFTYLYGASILFLLYVFCFLLQGK